MAIVDGRVISLTRKAILPFSHKWTPKARVAFSFDNIQIGTLISIGQLCDDNCIAIFSKYDAQIVKHNEIIIKRRRTSNGLWKIPLAIKTSQQSTPPSPQQAHVAKGIIKVNTTKGELAQYYAATLLNSTKSTLLRAIRKNHFTSWSALAAKLLNKHLPKRLTSVQGNMDQELKNLRSITTADEIEIIDFAPGQQNNNKKTMTSCAH